MTTTKATGSERDRGSATVLGVGAGLLLLSLLVGFLLVSAAVLGSLAARAAADGSALAAVGVLQVGGSREDACARAAELAVTNGATLVSCGPGRESDGVLATVVVEVAVPVPALGGVQAGAVAEAGLVPARAGR